MNHSIDISETYTRLLAITFEIDSKPIPDPSYINHKIGECNRLIDEVEKIAISVSRMLSILQRSLNDATARYESAKEEILTKDEQVKSQPNIRDREALANQKLKTERDEIRKYQNDVTDINNLLRAANLKLRNLNRSNADIKMQVRMMESQIKMLGAPTSTDAAARSLIAEMSKGISEDKDLAEETTIIEESRILDPTEPIDPRMIDPNPEPGTSLEEDDNDPDLTMTESLGELSEETVKAAEIQLSESTIDLDQIIDVSPPNTPLPTQGGEQQKDQKEEKPVSSQNAGDGKQKTIEGGIDIDSLLSQFA